MATLRELKTRIGSVASSEKITGAMKMISSAKVHKNEQALRRLLPFKDQIKSIMGHILASDATFSSPLIEERIPEKIAIVVFGSDDGLCGAYNINIFKQVLLHLNSLKEEFNPQITIIPVGKKIGKAADRIAGGNVKVERFKGVDSKMQGSAVDDFTGKLQERFLSGEYDRVEVIYMSFKSMSRQVLNTERLFPVDQTAVSNEASTVSADENKLYIFEPDPNRIFNEVLPMFVLSTMQEITIENRASEQAARVMAMQSANDNAKKLLEELQLEFNKLRQQNITTELLDILGGQVEH